jgi:pseudouridine-5'-monophosphatase
VKLLEPFGVIFTPEVKAKMMGRKDLEAAEVMIEHYGLEGKLDPHDFIQNRNKILEELFPDCQLMPGN